uniref:Uncharacterized protein n=1 Tax=Oryza sativa subsp. japonica TaxID=39947 RepID=Q6ERE1_ORYSJ|nr:hypothetical protein [Oryza sativa Japonica Group]
MDGRRRRGCGHSPSGLPLPHHTALRELVLYLVILYNLSQRRAQRRQVDNSPHSSSPSHSSHMPGRSGDLHHLALLPCRPPRSMDRSAWAGCGLLLPGRNCPLLMTVYTSNHLLIRTIDVL